MLVSPRLGEDKVLTNLSNVDKAAHQVLVAELSNRLLRLLPCSIFHNSVMQELATGNRA
jgi:hypothetical protein